MIKALRGVAAALLGLAAVAIGALALTLFIVGVVLSWAPLKGPIASWASTALERPATIRGPLDLDLSLRPRITASGVALANVDWGSEPAMFEAQRLTVEIDLPELLRNGRTVLARVDLLRPELLLERNGDGGVNWVLGGPSDGPPDLPEIRSLTVADGTITYRDPTLVDDLEATELDARGALPSGAPIRLAASGRLEGEPLDLDFEAGSLAGLHDPDEPYPLEVALRIGDSSGRVSGTIVRPMSPQRLDLEVAAESTGSSVLGSVLGLPPDARSYRLNARLTQEGESWAVSDLDARSGDSDLRGSISYDARGERPVIRAELASDRVTPDQLRPVAAALMGGPGGADAAPTGGRPAGPAPDRLFARLDDLRTVDAEIAYAAGEIAGGDLPVRAVEIGMRLHNGTLTVEPLRAELPDQQLTASLRLDAGQDPVPVQVELTMGETAASVGGALSRGPDAGPSALDIRLHSPDPSALTALLGLPADLPGTALAGRLGREDGAWTLSDLRAEVGASDLRGSIRLEQSGPRPSLSGELASSRLDVDELRRVAAEVRALTGAGEGEAAAAPGDTTGEAGGGTLWGVIASAAEALRAVDADVRLAADTVEAEGVPVRGFAGHVRLDDGVLAAERLRLDLPEATVTGSLEADARGAEIPVLVRATVGDSFLQVEGTLTEATAAEAFRITVAGDGENLATLNAALRPFVDWPLPETPPYEVAATVARDGHAWTFDDLKVALGQSDFTGALRYETGRDRPLVTGSLRSSRLDLPEMLVVAGLRATPETEVEEEEVATEFVEEAVGADGEPAGGGWVLPDASLRLPFLREVDGEIEYRGGEVRAAANLPVQELAVDLRLAGGVLTVDPLRVEAGGGQLAAWLTVDATEDPTGVDLDVRLRGFDARHLLALFGEDVEEVAEGGRLSARVALGARGGTLREALRAAAGDVAVIMEGGRISALVIEVFGFDLGEALIVWFADRDEEKDKVGVRCLVADFDVAQGVLEAQTLVLDTTDTTIVGGGIIDLATERLALTLEPHAKDASVLTAQTPIHLEGTFGDVEVNPETEGLVARGIAAVGLGVLVPVVGAIIPFIEPGLAEDSDCHGLIEAAQERHADEEGAGEEPIPR